MNVTEILDRLTSLVYPPRCVLCGEVVEYGVLWCGKCPMEQGAMAAANPSPDLDHWLSPLVYKENVRLAVLGLKQEGDIRVARFLAEQMHSLAVRHWTDAFDAIVPVPAALSKREKLGFHPCELLSDALGDLMGLSVENSILARSDTSSVQHMLSARERRENARRSYSLREEGPGLANGKRLLLLDDIKTTGSTLFACASLLKQAGAKSVSAITAAHSVMDSLTEQNEALAGAGQELRE